MLHTIPLGIVSSTAAAYLIEQSLLFDDTAYLNRTPSTAGNRKTWTYSVWFKLGNTATQQLFTAGDDNNNCSRIQYQSTGTIRFRHLDGGSVIDDVETNAVFRDSSAWYHIVVSVDTTQSTDTNRVKIYINGTAQSFGTTNYPTLNFDTDFNSTVKHTIGDLPADADHEFNGLMALPILVDGSALAPTAFGETDDDGFWNPIEFIPDTVGSNLTANYVTSVSNNGGGGFATSPVTFSSVDIGTASSTRKVIVGVGIDGYQGNEAYTSLTIGGVAANLVGVQNAASGGRPVALYELDVSSGTSADIVVTFTGTQTKCYSMGIGVWTIEGGTLFSTVGSTADPGAGNVNVPAGGTVIAIMTEGNAAATYAWANLTENFDNQVRASRQAFSGASKNLSSYTTQAISANVSGGSQFAMLAASFAPAGGIGINGFQLDFADTTDFGKDSAVADTSTTTPSASNQWTVGTANVTFTGDDYVFNAGDDAMYSANTFAVANWPMRYVVTMDSAGTLDNPNVGFGLFDNAEIGTFNHQSNSGGLFSMTKSWGVIPRSGVLTYGGVTQATIGALGNSSVAEFVIEADGTVRFYLNNVLKHEFTQKADGITVRFAAASSNTGLDYVDAYWQTNFPLFYRANNFTASDQLEDTPTDSADDGIGNFSTLDPNFKQGTSTLSEGNLKIASSSGWGGFAGIFGMDSGKYYWEQSHVGTVAGNFNMGVCRAGVGTSTSITGNAFVAVYEAANNLRANGSNSGNFTPSVTTDCIIGWAYDADTRKLWMAVDNTFVNLASAGTGNPATGANPTATISGTDSVFPIGQIYNASGSKYAEYNFGQKPFDYTPPTGYVALATQNLPADNELYTGTAAQYRAGAQVQSDALAGNSTGNANQSMRVVIPASAIADQSATRVRLKLKAASSQAFDTSHLYFGTNATGGSNAWDFTGDQVQVSVNGSTTISVAAGGSVYSDWFTFACDGTDPLCAAWLFAATGGGTGYAATSGHTRYYKTSSTSSTDASATSPSGFTAQSNYFMLIAAIEVQ